MTIPILVDTSCLLAMVDVDSAYHSAVMAILRNATYEPIIPAPVLPEVSHLIAKRIGHHVLRTFITNISIEKPRIAELKPEDYERVAAVLAEYADLRLDFADAAIMTLAERMQIQYILTLDRRDFRVFRPVHCQYFELLP